MYPIPFLGNCYWRNGSDRPPWPFPPTILYRSLRAILSKCRRRPWEMSQGSPTNFGKIRVSFHHWQLRMRFTLKGFVGQRLMIRVHRKLAMTLVIRDTNEGNTKCYYNLLQCIFLFGRAMWHNYKEHCGAQKSARTHQTIKQPIKQIWWMNEELKDQHWETIWLLIRKINVPAIIFCNGYWSFDTEWRYSKPSCGPCMDKPAAIGRNWTGIMDGFELVLQGNSQMLFTYGKVYYRAQVKLPPGG